MKTLILTIYRLIMIENDEHFDLKIVKGTEDLEN